MSRKVSPLNMLSARTVILLVVLLVVVSVIGTVVSMLETPDRNGLAADTYGTRAARLSRHLRYPHGFGCERRAGTQAARRQTRTVGDLGPLGTSRSHGLRRTGLSRKGCRVGASRRPGRGRHRKSAQSQNSLQILSSRAFAAKKRRRPRFWESQALRCAWVDLDLPETFATGNDSPTAEQERRIRRERFGDRRLHG